MDKKLLLKCFVNKKNGQVTTSLPKKKIPSDIFEKIKKGGKISIKFDSPLKD
jgi:hypothetical protein